MRRSLIVTLSLALTGFTAFCGYMAWYEYEGSNGSDLVQFWKRSTVPTVSWGVVG